MKMPSRQSIAKTANLYTETFATDGLVLGYQVDLYVTDEGRYVISTEWPEGCKKVRNSKAHVIHAAVRCRVSIQRKLKEPIHPDMRQIARLAGHYYDTDWTKY